jgi:hypothetical protein
VFATEEEAKADIHIQPVKQSVGSLWPEKLD